MKKIWFWALEQKFFLVLIEHFINRNFIINDKKCTFQTEKYKRKKIKIKWHMTAVWPFQVKAFLLYYVQITVGLYYLLTKNTFKAAFILPTCITYIYSFYIHFTTIYFIIMLVSIPFQLDSHLLHPNPINSKLYQMIPDILVTSSAVSGVELSNGVNVPVKNILFILRHCQL